MVIPNAEYSRGLMVSGSLPPSRPARRPARQRMGGLTATACRRHRPLTYRKPLRGRRTTRTDSRAASRCSPWVTATIRPVGQAISPTWEARWGDVADRLVREGRTKIEAPLVARGLALTETQTPPSTIARRVGVHHSAVRRILAAAPKVTGSGRLPSALHDQGVLR